MPNPITLFAVVTLMGLVGVAIAAADELSANLSSEDSLVGGVQKQLSVATSLLAACEADWAGDDGVTMIAVETAAAEPWDTTLLGAHTTPMGDAAGDGLQALGHAAWSLSSHAAIALSPANGAPQWAVASCDRVELVLPGAAGALVLQASPGFLHVANHDGACATIVARVGEAPSAPMAIFDTTLREGEGVVLQVVDAGQDVACPAATVTVQFTSLWQSP